MNRLLIAVAITSLTLFGCAAGDEDPTPEPTPEQPQRDPPKQVRAGQFANPYENIVSNLDEIREPAGEPMLVEPPIPSR